MGSNSCHANAFTFRLIPWYPPPTSSLGWIVPFFFSYKNSFGIKFPTKFDMSLNKETKSNQTDAYHLMIYHHHHHHRHVLLIAQNPLPHTVSLSLSLYIYIYIAIRFYQLSLPTYPLDTTQYPYRAGVCRFLLIDQNWCVHMYESI